MLLEEFTQETLIGEIHLFGNLLDALGRVLQKNAQFHHDIVVDPFVRCTTANGLYRFRQILRCDAKLYGIPADTAFMFVVSLNHLDEVGEDGFSACLWLVELPYSVDDIANVVEHSQ